MLKDQIHTLLNYIESKSGYLAHNENLLEIYEGNLLKYVLGALNNSLQKQSYEQIKDRVAPINVLTRIVDKLSKIYQQNPIRTLDQKRDDELLVWYQDNMRVNQKMNVVNEAFNLFKCSLHEILIHNRTPMLRPIPNDRFLVWSDDEVDPLNPTHIILIMDKEKKLNREVTIYHVYTDEEFIIFDSEGSLLFDRMQQINNLGVNPYGKYPFIYTNKSSHNLMPIHDSDTFAMTVLIPILLSDLNFASKFASFSIMYGININDENIKFAPNVFWNFKSDPETDQKPELGVIKPQVDIEATLSLIQSQFAFWLNTKGIRPGQIGNLTSDNFASGISKMIDEMDTYEDRKRQVEFFRDSERKMWNLIINNLHPFWVRTGAIDTRQLFPIDSKVIVNFAEQVPMLKRGDMVRDLQAEVNAGFATRKVAIKKLNPHMTENEIDEYMQMIDEERTTTIEIDEDQENAG